MNLTDILLGSELKTHEKQKLAGKYAMDFLAQSSAIHTSGGLASELARTLLGTSDDLDNPFDDEDISRHNRAVEKLTSVFYWTLIKYAPYWTYAKRSKEPVEHKGREVYPWRFANPTTWALHDE